jgi:hypothetical protein
VQEYEIEEEESTLTVDSNQISASALADRVNQFATETELGASWDASTSGMPQENTIGTQRNLDEVDESVSHEWQHSQPTTMGSVDALVGGMPGVAAPTSVILQQPATPARITTSPLHKASSNTVSVEQIQRAQTTPAVLISDDMNVDDFAGAFDASTRAAAPGLADLIALQPIDRPARNNDRALQDRSDSSSAFSSPPPSIDNLDDDDDFNGNASQWKQQQATVAASAAVLQAVAEQAERSSRHLVFGGASDPSTSSAPLTLDDDDALPRTAEIQRAESLQPQASQRTVTLKTSHHSVARPDEPTMMIPEIVSTLSPPENTAVPPENPQWDDSVLDFSAPDHRNHSMHNQRTVVAIGASAKLREADVQAQDSDDEDAEDIEFGDFSIAAPATPTSAAAFSKPVRAITQDASELEISDEAPWDDEGSFFEKPAVLPAPSRDDFSLDSPSVTVAAPVPMTDDDIPIELEFDDVELEDDFST